MRKYFVNTMVTKAILCVGLLALYISAFSGTVDYIEPPNWFVGMKNPNFQLLIKGDNIGKLAPTINYAGVQLVSVDTFKNKNYIVLNITISANTKAGTFPIVFKQPKKKDLTINYELVARKQTAESHAGFTPADIVYLLMPDRFCNGDTTNDSSPLTLEKANRSISGGRHGGDIKGMISKLDYLASLGVTAIWSTPLLENNSPDYSYHGYAVTNYYKIDPRYGDNQQYIQFAAECHKRNIKVIQDFIFNHCGVNHWLVKEPPADDWFHDYKKFPQTNYRATTIYDIHASTHDRETMYNGWFVPSMPDFNQSNPYVANYLIQNTIWWTETASLDGIRMDTQPYADRQMMSNWGKRMLDEYPNFNIVGEAWMQNPPSTFPWQKGAKTPDGYNSNIPSITDFPLTYALNSAFNENDGYTSGVGRLYDIFSQDFLYADSYVNLIFVGNHDLYRFPSAIDRNVSKFKMAMAVLMTARGIPQLYYGDEVLLDNSGGYEDGFKRKDFPGGWTNDKINFFTPEGRHADQQVEEAFNYLQKLATWRKTSKPVTHGKMMHYVPQQNGNVYAYFRYTDTEAVLVAFNNHETESKKLNTSTFYERMAGFTYGLDVISGTKYSNLSDIEIPAKSVLIIELKK